MTRDASAASPEAAKETTGSALHQQQQREYIAAANLMSEFSNSVRKSYGECKRADDRNTKEAAELLPAGERVTSADVKKSLLPVDQLCAFATAPSAPTVSDDEQEYESAVVDKDDDRGDEKAVEQADEEPGCEAENTLRMKPLKRNRRALFAAVDGDAEHNSSNVNADVRCTDRDGELVIVSSSDSLPPDSSEPMDKRQQKSSDGQEANATVKKFAHKRTLPCEIDLHTTRLQVDRPTTTRTVTTRNAFDDSKDESTLLIRKKWKRSLHQTTLSGAQQQQQSGLGGFTSLSQPNYPPFTRSMSSHSVFISKLSSISSTPSGISSSSSSAVSAQAHEVTIHQLVLPTIRSTSHPDLNVISPQTVRTSPSHSSLVRTTQYVNLHCMQVSRLLNGDFDAQLASYALIDCRFSYEHEGGSLRGAQSLCDPASVEQAFFWNPSKDCKRTALVFYCEFSANRAPKMYAGLTNGKCNEQFSLRLT